jgi:hypothetical protein
MKRCTEVERAGDPMAAQKGLGGNRLWQTHTGPGGQAAGAAHGPRHAESDLCLCKGEGVGGAAHTLTQMGCNPPKGQGVNHRPRQAQTEIGLDEEPFFHSWAVPEVEKLLQY